MDTMTLIAIAAMACVTWACRASGLLVAGSLPRQGRMGQMLAALPGCVMAALVAPEVAHGGATGWLAGGATVLAMLTTRSLPVAMTVGVTAAALLRWGGL